jgi:hypothetical protein
MVGVISSMEMFVAFLCSKRFMLTHKLPGLPRLELLEEALEEEKVGGPEFDLDFAESQLRAQQNA